MKKMKYIIFTGLISILFSFSTFATSVDQSINETIAESIQEETTESQTSPFNDDLTKYNTVGDVTAKGYKLVKIVDGIRVFMVDEISENVGFFMTENGESFGPITIDEIDGEIQRIAKRKEQESVRHIERTVDQLPTAKNIKINARLVFDNVNVDETSIYQATFKVLGPLAYRGEESIQDEYVNYVMTRGEGFTYSGEISMKDPEFTVEVDLSDDRIHAYTVHVDDEEFASKTFKSDQNEYNITIHVNLKENAIVDANEAPTLSEKDKKIFSGEFAESELNEMNKQQENKTEIKQKKNYLPIIVISSVAIILIIGGVLYIKKLREDD